MIDAITANITANTDALKPLMEKNAIQTEVVKLEQLKKEEEKRLTTIAEKDRSTDKTTQRKYCESKLCNK